VTAPTVSPVEVEETDDETRDDQPWVTVVWNDPINLMSYVTYVFQKLFGYDQAKAHKLMLDVHRKGRASVSVGSRDEMERDAARLHTYGLWATVLQD
jgi:ATP-dependent Clp protease adaptor protein ClpS